MDFRGFGQAISKVFGNFQFLRHIRTAQQALVVCLCACLVVLALGFPFLAESWRPLDIVAAVVVTMFVVWQLSRHYEERPTVMVLNGPEYLQYALHDSFGEKAKQTNMLPVDEGQLPQGTALLSPDEANTSGDAK